MSKRFAAIVGLCIAVWSVPIGSFAQAAQPRSEQSDDEAIRNERIVLNEALSKRNVDAFANSWMEDVNIIGYGGGLIAGRAEGIARFSKFFAGTDFVSGVRTPERIDVATGGPLEAAESGVFEWRVRKADEVGVARGRYLVVWKKIDGHWKIRSELYVRTSCTGSPGCN